VHARAPHPARESTVPSTCAHAESFSTALSCSPATQPQQDVANRLKLVAVEVLRGTAVSAVPVSESRYWIDQIDIMAEPVGVL